MKSFISNGFSYRKAVFFLVKEVTRLLSVLYINEHFNSIFANFLIIGNFADPPAFCKTADEVKDAYRGYKDINLNAMKIIKSGGFLDLIWNIKNAV